MKSIKLSRVVFIFYVTYLTFKQDFGANADKLEEAKYDLIDNGWIEIDASAKPNTFENSSVSRAKSFLVKCNKNYAVNSNSSYVMQILTSEHRNWMPVNDFLVPGIPLCARVCKYQPHLPNGFIEHGTNLLIAKKLPKSSNWIELIESSRIKFNCSDGFKMRTLVSGKKEEEKDAYIYRKNKHFTEKCARQDNSNKKLLYKRNRNSEKSSDLSANFIGHFVKTNQKKKESDEEVEEEDNHDGDEDDDDDDEEEEDADERRESYEENYEENKHNHGENGEEDVDDDNADDENNLGVAELDLKHKATTNEKHFHHECFKFCKPLKNIKFGFAVPTEKKYEPGQKINFLCNQEYVVELQSVNVKISEQLKLSNTLTLECSLNGTWLLIAASGKKLAQKLKIARIPKCLPLSLINSRENRKHLNANWPPYLTNADLNLRTFSMMFAIGAFIIAFLILSLVTLKFYRRKRNQLVFQNLSPQTDPLLEQHNYNPNNADLPREPTISSSQNNHDCISTIVAPSLAFGSIGSSSSLNNNNNINQANLVNNSYLPSYEEAISRPAFISNPESVRRNERFVNSSAVTRMNFFGEPSRRTQSSHSENSSNQKPSGNTETESFSANSNTNPRSQPVRSRSGSIRSNQTIQSANDSIRTANSLATNSSGNASFNLQPPPSTAQAWPTSSRSKRGKVATHPKHRLFNPNKNCDSSSAISEACTITTTTNSSLLSNQTNASKIPLRGSCSIIDSASTDSSSHGLAPTNNQSAIDVEQPNSTT